MRFRRFEVAEQSMRPTLNPGDYLIGRRTDRLARFDLVAFEHPRRSRFWLVKRVVGLGGETIDLDAGTVDGVAMGDPRSEPLVEIGRWLVPPEHVFVLSDDRLAPTVDSRTLGPVESDGCYRIHFRYWPPSELGRP